MIKELIAIANTLDSKGFTKEADALDLIIKKAMEGPHQPPLEFSKGTLDRLLEARPWPDRSLADDNKYFVYTVNGITSPYEGAIGDGPERPPNPAVDRLNSDLILETSDKEQAISAVYREYSNEYPYGFSAAFDRETDQPIFHSGMIKNRYPNSVGLEGEPANDVAYFESIFGDDPWAWTE